MKQFWCLMLGMLGITTSSWAREHEVSVRWPACTELPVDRGELTRVLGIALAETQWTLTPPDAVPPSDSSSEGPSAERPSKAIFWLDVEECSLDNSRVNVTLEWLGSAAPSNTTTLNLHDVPQVNRARTLAVALTELLRLAKQEADEDSAEVPNTSDPHDEPSSHDKKSLPETVPTPASTQTEAEFIRAETSGSNASRQQSNAFSFDALEAHALVSRLSSQPLAFWGGGIGARFRPVYRLAPHFGIDVEANSTETRWGNVTWLVPSLLLGVDLVLVETPKIAVGPSLRTLLLTGRGQRDPENEARRGVDWSAALSGRGSVEQRLGEAWSAFIMAETGVFLRDVRFTALGEPLIDFRGPTFRAAAGGVFHF